MKKRYKLFLLVAFVVLVFHTRAQVKTDSVFLLPEEVIPFTINNFYQLVVANHPVAKQTVLLSDMARQEIRLARGNFDPKLEASILKKRFEGKEYYSIINGGIKFPTYFPVDPTIGVDRNVGQNLNPERYIDDEFNYRQFYAGLSLPLGKGLFTDDRRTALKQAELFKEMTEADQVKIINKLLLDVAKDYWQWYHDYYYSRLTERNAAIAENIFNRVKINALNGELAAIDTVQAKITLQQRQIEYQESLLNFRNTSLHLSIHLWDSVGDPSLLPDNFAPTLVPDENILTLEELVDKAHDRHPDLLKIRVKIRQLEADQRLAKEYLKPTLNLNYYFLNQPFDPEWNTSLVWGDNYKFGMDFSMPVFLRKERAKVAQASIKITSTDYEQKLLERTVINQIQAAYNDFTYKRSILEQQQQMVTGYERLLAAEIVNLENGESDLFKINVQQEKLLQSQAKALKLLTELEKQKANLYWAAGTSYAYPN